jgi:hypothetical protein
VPPAPLNYRRHFVLLACAIVVIAIMAKLEIFGAASLLPNAAIYGALHAAALCGALTAAAPLARKSLFMLAAAALDVAALYAGLFGLALLSAAPLPLRARAFLALGVCSMVGAILYGLLIRFFWVPELSPRPIMQISIGCLIATMLTMLVENLTGLSSLWALAAVWWCAFSGGLCLTGRMQALRPRASV